MLPKDHFRNFVKVQLEGKFNMYTESEKACEAAGLTTSEYYHILYNYKDYMRIYPEVRDEEEAKLMKELINHKS